jgi:FMN-binding domain
MKRAPLLVLGGTVAGFIGVLSFHTRSAELHTSGGRTGGGNSGGTPVAAPRVTPVSGESVRSSLGASEQFGYGVLDVKVTVRGTRITDVSVPTLQVAEATSQQICEQAIPILRSEVLSAQSGSIDGVSGATFTSEAYAQSLQAALDALHMK